MYLNNGFMLHGRTDSVLGAVQDAEDAADNVILNNADLHLPHDDIYEVYDNDGRLLGRSPNWQGSGNAWMQPGNGFSQLSLNNRDYRILRQHGSRMSTSGEARAFVEGIPAYWTRIPEGTRQEMKKHIPELVAQIEADSSRYSS